MKDSLLLSMKERLQNREGEFKTEVDSTEKLRLELTHAEARIRLAEGCAEKARKKADDDYQAKTKAEEEKC